MSTNANPYRATTQLHTVKSSSLNESALRKEMKDTTILKFDGNLEVDDAAAVNHFNQEEFLDVVNNATKCYGLQSFFHTPNSNDDTTYIVDEPHTFNVNIVLNEHLSRLIEPDSVIATDACSYHDTAYCHSYDSTPPLLLL